MRCVTTPASPRHGNPLVSAIITTHNREPDMVLRAVYSVLNQTYQNIELIVVDDSPPSFARRAEVEQSVLSVSDDILYLKHEVCQGPCAARNTGLRHAGGTYVGFLDDDDEWMPTKIEEQLKGFHEEGISGEEMETYLPMMDQVNPAYMAAAIAWMTETCGSPLGYIMQELGVTEEEIAALRNKFLE